MRRYAKNDGDMLQGTLDMLVLKSLQIGPMHGWGITGWHDALIGGYAGLDDPTQAYLDLIEAGELTARVTASQWWDRDPDRDIDEQVEALAEQRDRLGDAGLDASSVKVMMDGITETFTASVADPYLGDTGCPCGDTGLPFLDPEVASLAIAMPPKVIARGGWSKWPLRQTLDDLGGATPAWRRGKRWSSADRGFSRRESKSNSCRFRGFLIGGIGT